MKVENQKFTRTIGGWSQGATARVLVKVENQKFTGTVRGKARGCDGEGSSEVGKAEVH